jgi:membrane protein DedA with SNARE-associated domain
MMSAMTFLDANLIQNLIASYGYAAIFFVVLLESSGIPLPGETILVCASVYAGTQHGLDIRVVIGVAACGAILGDNIGYWVGRTFGRALLLRYGNYVGIGAQKLALGEYLFMRYGGSIVFFGRFVALLRVYAALLAGINRLKPVDFALYNGAGGLVWASSFGLTGYFLGKNLQHFVGPGRSSRLTKGGSWQMRNELSQSAVPANLAGRSIRCGQFERARSVPTVTQLSASNATAILEGLRRPERFSFPGLRRTPSPAGWRKWVRRRQVLQKLSTTDRPVRGLRRKLR